MPRLIDEPEITSVDTSYYIPLASQTGVTRVLPSNLPFVPAGANAVQGTLQAKLRKILHKSEYSSLANALTAAGSTLPVFNDSTGTLYTGCVFARGNSDVEGTFRVDAQAEFLNPGGLGRELIVLGQMRNPGVAYGTDNTAEAAISYHAFDNTGFPRQMASLSAIWSNTSDPATGYAVFRINVDGVAGASNIAVRVFGGDNGVTFFDSSITADTAGPGYKGIKIQRAASHPSIAGMSDIAIDANYGGSANSVFLNAYNAGDVVLALGGGDVKIGKALVALGGGSSATLGTIGGSGPAAATQNTWLRLLDSAGSAFWVPAWK